MPETAKREVTIVGAGIVGIATALSLTLDGHRVRLVDPRAPGTATSFGNAGAIVPGGIVPTATPGLWRRVPRMLLDPMSPLKVRWRYLPSLAPWLIRFLRAGRHARAMRIAGELSSLKDDCLKAHQRLARTAGAEDLLRPVGWLKVYKDAAAFAGTSFDRAVMDRYGVRYEVLGSDDLRQLEPALSHDFSVGLFQPDACFASTPYALARAYVEAIHARDGEFVQDSVRRFEFGEDGRVARIVTERGIHPVDVLVLAAGAWSRPLARQLGVSVPLDTERGYHLNLAADDEARLTRPVVVGGPQFVLAPMQDGIRLTAGVELAGLHAPPDFRRIKGLLPLARAALPGLTGEITREWMGHRPSTPDSKPVIGPVPDLRDAYLAFGHGHMGLGLSAVTGALIADLVAGRSPAAPLAPFLPERF